MENRTTHNLTNPDIWIRLVYMILFWLLLLLARVAIGVLAGLQFLLVLLTGSDNENLRALGESVSQWTLQAMRFLTFNSDDKPFPFQDWPAGAAHPIPPESSVDRAAAANPEAEANPAEDAREEPRA